MKFLMLSLLCLVLFGCHRSSDEHVQKVKIVGVEKVSTVLGRKAVNAELVLDHAIPNKSIRMVVMINGKGMIINLYPINTNNPTIRFSTQWEEGKFEPKDLLGNSGYTIGD